MKYQERYCVIVDWEESWCWFSVMLLYPERMREGEPGPAERERKKAKRARFGGGGQNFRFSGKRGSDAHRPVVTCAHGPSAPESVCVSQGPFPLTLLTWSHCCQPEWLWLTGCSRPNSREMMQFFFGHKIHFLPTTDFLASFSQWRWQNGENSS